ncbi:Oxoglutarate/iron-dependent dioxygenase [Penicillium concentricum]|uniref:Oxoglutarate/iron-dependent dioxygenase n=1 Tax=Penicillium concentricum TaxID=293559 RepID=A0A9W9SX09_9EURO|nr:Oxoglutarate/iron-dependent dioxygenase [Penicillium concentricum]KAJ5384208.1 Oxoglutarate/iron-dependent dioxygenase [Penicillium concentricum]
MAKRTLDSFFKPSTTPPKRPKTEPTESTTSTPETSNIPIEDTKPPSQHPSYPIPITQLPSHIEVGLEHATPAASPLEINNQPHLDLLYFQPYIPRPTANELFKFLRRELPFYRVQYTARRGDIETQINTPRWTTVFGVDETSTFIQQDNDLVLLETKTKTPTPKTKYQCTPRPIPACLDLLRKQVEAANATASGPKNPSYNFCLVNYYASGEDSIAFHSDDERFLGPEPNIASLSLGGERDFLMKHKPFSGGNVNQTTGGCVPGAHAMSGPGGTGVTRSRTAGGTLNTVSPGSRPGTVPRQIKMSLGSGDMVVMRGATQSNWLHSIPKRKGKGEMTRGRINITFRRAVVPGGTNNYYHYNVGSGGMYRWDEVAREMVLRDGKGERATG